MLRFQNSSEKSISKFFKIFRIQHSPFASSVWCCHDLENGEYYVDLIWSWVFKKHDACSKFVLLASHCPDEPKKKKEGEACFIHEWYGYSCNFCALSHAGRVHCAALNKTHPRYFFPTSPDRLDRHYSLPVLASSFRPCRNLSKGAFLVSFIDRSLIQSAMGFIVLKIGSASGFSLSQSPNSQ